MVILTEGAMTDGRCVPTFPGVVKRSQFLVHPSRSHPAAGVCSLDYPQLSSDTADGGEIISVGNCHLLHFKDRLNQVVMATMLYTIYDYKILFCSSLSLCSAF